MSDENERMAELTVAQTAASCREQEELVRRVTDARKALELCATTYKRQWEDWLKLSEGMLPELRQWRMAMDSEMSNVLAKFADVRRFFLSADHDSEVARLREFVALCERLKALKDDGFLDRVADTILRLEVK